jgi:hypothetical protein
MRLPRRSAIVRMFGSFAISQRSPSFIGARNFHSTPRAHPTSSGPTPPAPTWMSPAMIPFVIAAPEASTFHSTRVPGQRRSIERCSFMMISGV